MNGAQLLKAYGDSSGLMSGPPALAIPYLAEQFQKPCISCQVFRFFKQSV
jgi:hypothetical protein